MDIHKFFDIVVKRLLEVAAYQKIMCGKVQNLGKAEQSNVEKTSIHSALTYMDMFTQDYLMVPIYREFPFLIPLVEEATGMKQHHLTNQSEYTLFIDPIDGTLSYTLGENDYSIMVGLLKNGILEVGIVCYPEMGKIFGSIRGEGVRVISFNGDSEMLPSRPLASENSAKNVAVHYRFLKEPYAPLAKKLTDKGYTLVTNKTDFGTNASGIFRILYGKSCVFIGPHITLHDFGAPALMIQEKGGAIQLFDYAGKDDVNSWQTKVSSEFKFDIQGPTPRFRVMIADNQNTIKRILTDMEVI